MDKSQTETLNIGKQDAKSYSKQSANTLFNFMRDIKFLITNIENLTMYPRYVIEDVNYLELKYGTQSMHTVAFPMLCFCDIHLHKLPYHVEKDDATGSIGYGKFGIGLSKSWCEDKGLQPITYLNKNSKTTQELSYLMNKGLTTLHDDLDLDEEFFDYILNSLRLSKPLTGVMQMGGKDVDKNFHDEREWRFIPDFSDVEMGDFLNDATMPNKMSNNLLKKMSDTLINEPSTHLKLSVDAINYIFVETNDDRNKVLDTIKRKWSQDMDTAMILASKIVVYEQIVRDW
ncbi:TPA: abortive infection system antitoxin AbiGi family protein [Listeria monocytogenes]